MNQIDIEIPGVGKEKIVLVTRRHWASMLGIFGLILLMIIFPVFLVISLYLLNPAFFTGILINLLVILGAIYYLVVAAFAFLAWVDYYYDIFIFTEDEIIDINQGGFFNRYITQIAMTNIQDVSAHIKGVLPTIFGYGDVTAESAGDKTQTYIIDGIPDPMSVADKILEIHNQSIARRRQKELEKEEAIIKGEKPKEEEKPKIPDSTQKETLITKDKEVEISKDDLNKGGEIKL